ncbi:N-terminal methionine N(alpha)-acetyltransferase NatE [Malassezia vespertilionis]|uniref:Pre-mRNA-splicing factor CWC24 n=1 Tax=Malassezia vespertilionis TaxID=2020962 RepID=A0A2N1JAM4_9BASI|nr:N-terminal methionine N(alpha)-acetyltransferase NatE [Malassezia vespertilionis]PKI83552.1 Cwc24p [Malassezia vespertilionis]WFD07263.1 N-terminal methionine N(alpha)-acetyltransferase NatE [Malassezia vespertilionis]
MTDVVFKKKSRAGARNVRKRDTGALEEEASAEKLSSAVVTKKKRVDVGAEARPLDRFGARTVHAAASASGSAMNDNQNQRDSTRHTDWDLETEFTRELGESKSKASNDDGKYRGMSSYSKYTEERDDGSSAKFKAKGPIRAPTNVRTITVVDYQPDVCKDYKETGYCGFGDTCKFLHDRSDYLAGWQMDSVEEAADARAGTFGQGLDEEVEEDVPFACLLCRQPFEEPVVTLCGHYFCAKCAIQRYTKTPKCFACGAKTHGLFNAASKILHRMNKRHMHRTQDRREKRRQHGMDSESEEEQILDGVVVGE